MNVNKLVKRHFLCQQHKILLSSTRSSWFDLKKKGFFREISPKEEPTFFSETEPNPLSDIERRIEESKQRLKWRKPFTQQTTFLTESLRFFAPERTKHFFEIIQRPFDKKTLLEAMDFKKHEVLATDQRFIPDRHRILGNDLAAAHFLVARGGQVR